MLTEADIKAWQSGRWTWELGKSVQRATSLVWSPSQVVTWLDCPRKWGWGKIARLEQEQTKSTELGEDTHEQLENHLEGRPLDFVKAPGWAKPGLPAELATTAFPVLPRPKAEGLVVEWEFSQKLSDRPWYWTGRIDWFRAWTIEPDCLPDCYCGELARVDRPCKPCQQATRFQVTIGDHKTTSSFDWAKTPEDLLTDPQAIIYAKWAMTHYPSLDWVALQWTYIRTKGGRVPAKPVLQVLHRAHVDTEFTKLELVAADMAVAKRTVTNVLELPFNSDTCDKYGGCPFQANCHLSVTDRQSPLNQRKRALNMMPPVPPPAGATSPMLAALQAQAAQIAPIPGITPGMPPVPGQPVHTAPAVMAPPVPQAPNALSMAVKRDMYNRVTSDLQGRDLPGYIIQAQQVEQPLMGSGQWVPIEPLDAVKAHVLAQYAEAYRQAAVQGLPPGTMAPDPVPQAAPAPVPVPAPQAPALAPPQGWAPQGMPVPPPAPPGAGPVAGSFGPTPLPPAGPINPPEANLPPAPPSGLAAPPAGPPVPPPTPLPTAETKPAQEQGKGKGGRPAGSKNKPKDPAGPPVPGAAPEATSKPKLGNLTLFLGCRPVKGWGEDELTDFSAVVAEAGKLIKEEEGVEDYSLLDWGKSAGALTGAVSEVIGNHLANGDLYLVVDTRTRESGVVLNKLVAMAATVFKGV